MPEREEELYEPVKKALYRYFQRKTPHFEITAHGITNIVKPVLNDLALYYINVESFKPDIMGWIGTHPNRQLMTVEIKPEPKLEHIFQAKKYGEVFDASHALLISPEQLPEELFRLLKKRPDLLSYACGYKKTTVIAFDPVTGEFYFWFPAALET